MARWFIHALKDLNIYDFRQKLISTEILINTFLTSLKISCVSFLDNKGLIIYSFVLRFFPIIIKNHTEKRKITQGISHRVTLWYIYNNNLVIYGFGTPGFC